MLLELATVASVSGGAVNLTMSSAGLARRVMESANAEMLRDALKETFKVDLAIRCSAAEDASSAPPQRTAPAASRPAEAPPLPPEPDPYDDVPDDYGSDPEPGAVQQIRDPEEIAIELLTEQLGAQRINRED